MSGSKNTFNFDVLRTEFKDILKKAFKSNNLDLLENKISTYKRTELDIKTPLDQAFRDILLDLLGSEVNVTLLKSFVEFTIGSCRRHYNTPTIPVVLLGDIFDTLTLDACQDMFSFVEENVHVWKEDLFFSGCKNHLLRLCNDLLRRLSRTTATVFCGKILLFLAKFFPFSERSGLNIVSEFNLENITEYGTDSTDDIVAEIISEDQKHVIDFSFYCKFWQLQDFFRNPNQCYDKVQWKMFCSHSMNILNTFNGIKLDYVTSSDQNANVGYFAKYLTSQKLLDLQLHDVSFRRSVLLQFLIIFQYLTSSVKFKSDSYELKADQKEWIQNYTEKVYNLLRETPPDGDNFAQIIRNILKREELWNAWKNDGCPDCLSALQKLKSVSPLTKINPLVANMLIFNHETVNQGKTVMLVCVKPHVGIEENETLDKRAKEATNNGLVDNNYKTQKSDIFRKIKEKMHHLEIKKFLPQSEPVESEKNESPKTLVGDLIKDANDLGKYYMGSPELTKLWNFCPNNLEACKNRERDFLPSLEEYFADAIAQLESPTPVKDDENILKDSNFGWRALRLLARRSPYFFSISTQNHPLSMYLEVMVNKTAHEKPGRHDENSQEGQNEQEMEENILTEEQNPEDFKQHEEFADDNNPRRENKDISSDRMQIIIEKIVPEWEKLGNKLGYKPDEIEWFKNENTLRFDQAKNMMALWFEDDEDANLDNLLYILEGLEMNKAAEAVRNELNNTMES